MNRRQRRSHARLWPLLALIMAVVIGAGLMVQQRIVASIALNVETR